MRLISIDPGCPGCGVAVWEDGLLTDARYIAGDAQEVYDQLPQTDALTIEVPMFYGNRASKEDVDFNDLIKLAMRVGEFKALFESFDNASINLVLPPEWKKQVPKEICAQRSDRKLSEKERANISQPKAKKIALDMWDAIGIGLVSLGRLRPGLV